MRSISLDSVGSFSKRAFTCAIICSVRSKVVPGGSVIDRLERSVLPAPYKPVGILGMSERLAAKIAIATPTVRNRCRSAIESSLPYGPLAEALEEDAGRIASASSGGTAFNNRAASSGVTNRATSVENIVETATVTPNGLKNWPGMPPMNATGIKTATMVAVVVMTARPTSAEESSAACVGRLPIAICRSMFSISTIASSTRLPTASVSASSVILLSE